MRGWQPLAPAATRTAGVGRAAGGHLAEIDAFKATLARPSDFEVLIRVAAPAAAGEFALVNGSYAIDPAGTTGVKPEWSGFVADGTGGTGGGSGSTAFSVVEWGPFNLNAGPWHLVRSSTEAGDVSGLIVRCLVRTADR